MIGTHWSPKVARAMHEVADATPLPPLLGGDLRLRAPRAQRKVAVSIAAVALVVVGIGGTVAILLRDVPSSRSELPSATVESTAPAAPSLFDSGTSLIVWVNAQAAPEQLQFIRNAIIATGVVTSDELEYLDAAATFAEASRVLADDPLALALLNESNVSTAFHLFPADPAFDADQWRVQFQALPMVVLVEAPTDEPITMVPADSAGTDTTLTPETTDSAAP